MIDNETLDQILALQIKIARAGELERLSWWQVDATDIAGGGDFFSRLVGPLSGLCSVEAALEGAKILEQKKLEDAQVAYEVVSLFYPEFPLR
ncbi:MAG: BrxE family protein, partial [SAR324 cluster bacterium]|nr:BrxE family protein [SAR324 cluster bacterium]